ncbi:MAG: hypothetical protein J3R72DRAFT_435790 [Linnemannia gamsii]|nr:MAG: hypothetical protein J3R72DRAFT_435790 [Linnemannia gamsii]
MSTTTAQTHSASLPSGEVLRISPQQFYFTASRVSPGQVSKVKLKNLSSSPVGYKFKTNAPMKYSVKPVLGVLAPDESVKIFVRCDNWISPQDRFLLQSIILTDNEAQCMDSSAWKSLDPKRFIECYIPCISVSVLSLRDPEDDTGSLSSSSTTSTSTTSSHISPPLHAIDLTRLPPPQLQRSSSLSGSSSRQQVFERWQYSETMRPTVSIGGVGRRLSNSSLSSTTSPSLGATNSASSGSYPTLFTPITTPKSSMDYYFPSSPTASESSSSSARSSQRNSISLNSSFHSSSNGPNIITSTIVEEPLSLDALPSTPSYYYSRTHTNASTKPSSSSSSPLVGTIVSPGLLPGAKKSAFEKLGFGMGLGMSDSQRRQSMFRVLWEYTRGRILVLSLVCLFLGLVFPMARPTQRNSNSIQMDTTVFTIVKVTKEAPNNNFDAIIQSSTPVQATNMLLGIHLKEDW